MSVALLILPLPPCIINFLRIKMSDFSWIARQSWYWWLRSPLYLFQVKSADILWWLFWICWNWVSDWWQVHPFKLKLFRDLQVCDETEGDAPSAFGLQPWEDQKGLANFACPLVSSAFLRGWGECLKAFEGPRKSISVHWINYSQKLFTPRSAVTISRPYSLEAGRFCSPTEPLIN